MKNPSRLVIATLLFMLLFSALLPEMAHAATSEELCQARKNREVSRFVACRHRVASGLPDASFRRPTGHCRQLLNRRWRRITTRFSKKGVTCFDAPLSAIELRTALNSNILDILDLLGKNETGIPAQRRCRAIKTLEAGRYAACRYRAESFLARTADNETYSGKIYRCESNFSKAWLKIINRTANRGATCFDDHLSIQDFKTEINSQINKVTGVLEGVDQFKPVTLSLAGTPLHLSANGDAGHITISNTSDRAPAINIKADFSATALEGAIEVTGNTCSYVSAGAECTITFTPKLSVVPETTVKIKGGNTVTLSAKITVSPEPLATLSITGSPLSLTFNGASESLTLTNTSAALTALDIGSDFTGTALDGTVTETGNTCASVAPGASCILTFTPGNALVPATSFTIQGSNTKPVSASINVQSGSTLSSINPTSGSASGGTGITLTGTGLTGATVVTFDGIAATSVNVINSTTVTAVAPPHVVGAVDVVIDTPAGGANIVNGYTYHPTSEGQSAYGGTIACLDGGLQNLIAATVDNSALIEWGEFGIAIGAGAQSHSDGAANTPAIISVLGNGSYAAQVCNDFEIDSQGNSPCEPGNTCYNDWFLPSISQLYCLDTNYIAIGGFAATGYWSSTEYDGMPNFDAWGIFFGGGGNFIMGKDYMSRVRCVRAFTP